MGIFEFFALILDGLEALQGQPKKTEVGALVGELCKPSSEQEDTDLQ